MPNHVLNKVYAAPSVLDALRGAEDPVDFAAVVPRPDGLFTGDVNTLANDCAEKAFNEPPSGHPMVAALEASNKARWSASDLDDRGFEDFISMLRSKRATGFYHGMEFARSAWGTKWNAYSVERHADHVSFQTAWSSPEPVYLALSAAHPNEEIRVEYADEDRGSNCASLRLRGGRVVDRCKRDLLFALDLWGDDDEARADYLG